MLVVLGGRDVVWVPRAGGFWFTPGVRGKRCERGGERIQGVGERSGYRVGVRGLPTCRFVGKLAGGGFRGRGLAALGGGGAPPLLLS